ncbi:MULTISPECIES: protein kinase domain-containing protein [Streptomyces]|uniref:non-specific serine/threonine protein kinase n=2 Tax=Streptomyces TaxID=1883 RepID=A0A3M8F0W8_9ACTN|nr:MULTISPECIES: serine/threonine-protein kinase [Streptomyces]OFA39695.1 serine/threonine protein kinase [Streptomyces fradiae]PQM21617.1 serine/threonine protein kinase [Streptomyces xinghaiensis]RKM94320.1 serine/threonine protein kinase [Streptomyces xinghaiensis]RNC71920.1 serine/threonine protein kinase [Streptomyces xinghaiensis]
MSEPEQTQGATGRILAGRYRLGEVLGRGGMGTVWRAVDETLGRQVAVKELRFPSSVDEDEKRRLITRTLREAKAIARIRANGGITVYDVVDEDDRPWIVMELIEGSSLAEVIRDKGRLSPRRAAEVGLAVLDVLRAAHREGILHRDVKPSNVLISGDDSRVVLTDFGIAQVEGDPSVTSTGMLVGAPSYISPERARGHKPGPPSDLWSLGGLLYACVEGVPPYDKGNGLATLTAVMTEPVPPPEHAGPLADVIYGLLEKDPQRRLDDAGARALLTRVLAETEERPQAARTRTMAVPAEPSGKEAKGSKGNKGTKRAAVAGAGAAGGAVGAAAGASVAGSGTGGGSGTGRKPEPASAGEPAAGADAPAGSAADSPSDSAPQPDGRSAKEGRLRSALRSARAAAAAGAASKASSPASSASEPSSGPASSAGTAAPATATHASPSADTGTGARRPVTAAITDVVPRRVLALIAGVLALAVLGVVLAFTLDDDGSGGDPAGGAKDDRAATSGAEGGTDDSADAGKDAGASADPSEPAHDGTSEGKPDDEGSAGKDGGQDGESGKDGGTDAGDADKIPEGYETKTENRFNFSMAMPGNWKLTRIAGQNSGGEYSEAGGIPRIQIDFSSQPKDDAVAAWRAQEQASRGSFPGYSSRGIKSAEYRDYPTVADWEFEYNRSGERVRVLNRGFKVDDGRAYSIMITCVADEWDGKECTTLRETAFRTFKPTG